MKFIKTAARWAVLAGLLVLGLVLSRPARADAPVVRFIELGHQGVIFPDAPAFADIEISAASSFRGSFEATLRYGIKRFETDELSVSDRVVYRFEANARERKRLTLCFPESTTESPRGKDVIVEIGWRLLDESGREAAKGKENAQTDVAVVRVLALTRENSPSYQRAPEDAFKDVAHYMPFAVVLISVADLANLEESQQQALWDAAVLGMSVVVVGPLGALGPPWDGLLSSEQVVWTDGAGSEIREAAIFEGRLRRTNLAILPPPKLETTSDPRFPSYSIATTPGNLLPSEPGWFGNLRHHASALSQSWLPSASRELYERLNTLSVGTAFLAVLAGAVLWRASHPVRPLNRKTALAAIAVLLVSIAMFGALFHEPAGHVRGVAELCLHDPGGRAAILRSVRALGGGGGGEDVSLTTRLDPRTAVRVDRLTDVQSSVRLLVETGDGDSLKLSVPRGAWTGTNLVEAFTDQVTPPDSPWESQVRWAGERLVGSLAFHRSFRRVLLIVNEPAERKGLSVIRLGSPRSGGVVEVGRLPAVPVHAYRLRETLGEDAELYENEALAPTNRFKAWAFWPHQRHGGRASALVLAEEEGEEPRRIHVGSVMGENRPTHEEWFEVPGFQEGLDIHALVPGNLDASKVRLRWRGTNFVDVEPRAIHERIGATDLVFAARSLFDDSGGRVRRDLPSNTHLIGFAVEVSE